MIIGKAHAKSRHRRGTRAGKANDGVVIIHVKNGREWIDELAAQLELFPLERLPTAPTARQLLPPARKRRRKA